MYQIQIHCTMSNLIKMSDVDEAWVRLFLWKWSERTTNTIWQELRTRVHFIQSQTQARNRIKIHRCCVKHSLKQYGTNDRFPHFWRRVLSSYLLLSDVTHRSVIGRKVPCDISNGWQFKACMLYLKCKVCWLLYSILKVYSHTCIYITR